LLDTALGRSHRVDPVLPRTGGPAGNAQTTAGLGLLILLLFLAELVTLLDVSGLISWHIAIGVILVPPALAKCGTTGWRIVRYYAGAGPYRRAGPPPMPLRMLGPFVIATTIAVLGSGLALLPLGPDSGRTPLFSLLGKQISPLTIHQGIFILWCVATGLHVLARTVHAVRLLTGSRPAGTPARLAAIVAAVAVGGVAAALVLGASGSWTNGHLHHHERHPRYVGAVADRLVPSINQGPRQW
jgi:hypothetical protein